MTNALIFGKFAPPHLGHLELIKRACDDCTRVIVLISENPEIVVPEAKTRAQWLKKSISSSNLVLIPTGVFPPGGTDEASCRANFLYIQQYVHRWQIDRVYCNEWYGEDIAQRFGAEWVQTDPKRIQFHICAQEIRRQPHKHIDYLPTVVQKEYLSFLKNVAMG